MRKTGLSACVVALCVWWQAAWCSAQEFKPVVVGSIAAYDELLKDIEFVGKLTDNPDLAKSVEGFIGFFTQFQGLAGLDKSKPIGVIFGTDGAAFQGFGFIPVSELDKLLGALMGFVGQPEDAGDGVKILKIQAATIFLKEQKGWAFLAIDKAALAVDLPTDPSKLLGGLHEDYDLGVRVHVQNVPQPYRDFAVQQIQQGAQGGLRKESGESDAQFELRQKITQQGVEQLAKMIQEIDQISVGLAIDSTEKIAFEEFGITAVKGSDLAKQLQSASTARSKLAGFLLDDGVIRVHGTAKMNPTEIEQSLQVLRTVRAQADKGLENETFPDEELKKLVTSAANELFEVANETLKSGEYSLGAVVVGEGPFDGAAGAALVGGDRLEKIVKSFLEHPKAQEEMKKANVEAKFNSGSHKGVTFHEVVIPVPGGDEGETIKKFLGDEIVVTLGFSKDRAFIGVGEESEDLIIDVIDESAAPADDVPLFEVSAALEPILQLIKQEKPDDAVLATFADSLEAPDDHVSLYAVVKNGGSWGRVEIEESVLRAIGLAIKAGIARGR